MLEGEKKTLKEKCEVRMHSTNVRHFQLKLMDGKLFSNSIFFCANDSLFYNQRNLERVFNLLGTVRSNHALVNKRSDFFLKGVAFCFKCINCDPTPTSR